MPESHGRKKAENKKKTRDHAKVVERKAERAKVAAATPSPRWIAPAFITVGLAGVLWLVVYYVAGSHIKFMANLGALNVVISLVLIAASFVIMSFWK